jgi:hypothetical protein
MLKYHKAPANTDPAITARELRGPGDTMFSVRGWHALPQQLLDCDDSEKPRRIGPAVGIRHADGSTTIVISPR